MKVLKTHRVSRIRFLVVGLLLLVGLTGCHQFGMPGMGHPMMPGDGNSVEEPAHGDHNGPEGFFSFTVPGCQQAW